MENQLRGKKGITLIALVITIIVLLILAGVTIVTLTGDNGILKKVGDARNNNEKATEKEKIQAEVMGSYDLTGKLDVRETVENIRNNIKDVKTVVATENNFPVRVTYNNDHSYQVKSNGKVNSIYVDDNYIAVIPDGFTVSNTEGEKSIKNGLVVKDHSENEWIWIPVSSSDLQLMYTENSAGWQMSKREVTTNYKTIGVSLQGRTLDRTNPGSTGGYREPDVVTSLDSDDNNRKTAGFLESDGTTASSIVVMATKLKDDYKNMIDSIKENGGFYVGRYELGKDQGGTPQEKPGPVMNHTKWYNLYNACKYFSGGDIESRMIWGCQWDQICRFLNQSGEKVPINDSRAYGNYENSTGNAKNYNGKNNYDNTTGRNNAWKANNIYDIAGNCWEWTQEAYGSNGRAIRGRMLCK